VTVAARTSASIAILTAVLAQSAAQGRQDTRLAIQPLHAGNTLELTLSNGQAARYAATLAAGQWASVVVKHRDIDVVVRWAGDESEPEATIEIASDGPTGELRMPVLASRSGPRVIEVAAAYPKSGPGTYTIGLEGLRGATATDAELAEAYGHHSRARRLRSTGKYLAALTHAETSLALREKALGPRAPEVARSLLLLAQLNDAAARFGVADGLYLRLRRILDGASGGHELLRAEMLDSQAASQTARGAFREAAQFASDALAIRERILGPHHVHVAASLGTLADLHHENAHVQEARIAADRALDAAARSFRPGDVEFGDFVNRVARSQLAAGNYARAEQLYLETLAVRERTGPDTLPVAETISNLARVALQANDNVKAERLLTRSIALQEQILGREHPRVAGDVQNLGLIHYRRRDYTSAIALFLRALAAFEKTLGPTQRLTAACFNNLGLVYWRQRDYPRAEEFFRRSLAVYEQLYGADSLRVTSPLGNLGIIAKETGNYALAEARYQRVLAIQEKHLGPEHPDLVVMVESLAILYRDSGDYPRSEKMFQRAVEISVASRGPDHPIVARHLDNITHLHWAMGNWDQALAARQRVAAIEERGLRINLSVGSERQKLEYFGPLLRNLEETISYHVQDPTANPAARDLAVTSLLQRKGRVLDALADNVSAFRSRATAGHQTLLDEFVKVTGDLAAAVLGNPAQATRSDRQRRVTVLTAERERLESEIQRHSAGYLEPSRTVTLADVKRAIPGGAALLEFSVFRPFDPRASFESGKQFGPPRYVAYVIRHGADTVWKDLGTADEVDRLVERFRSALADPARQDFSRVSTALHRQLIAPLEPFLADAAQLLVSPDGSLNLVPFEALRSAAGRYLVEDRSITYVTTGRDLVRLLAPRPAPGRAALFANPDFGGPSSVYFAPLAGTASEARQIHALFPDLDLRLGGDATERALRNLQAPRILHIATHGFFLQDNGAPDATRTAAGPRALNAAAQVDNPLLRAGLALAGANAARGSDDGLLTALEAAQLNLWGTKLVTLSACDTGVGVVRNGEGVYGLRRAFFLAGAETLVMSLWPVSDLVTREIMTGYYAGLENGLGRGAALRRVQLRMLKRKGRAHPFYWASFIVAGEWATLDGRT
jgi:CHAT domain-containing protein/tetratricopeptide (TPR) repeat protein